MHVLAQVSEGKDKGSARQATNKLEVSGKLDRIGVTLSRSLTPGYFRGRTLFTRLLVIAVIQLFRCCFFAHYANNLGGTAIATALVFQQLLLDWALRYF